MDPNDAEMVMESIESEPKLYRLVGEGLGGTFVWPDDKWVKGPRPIGTKGCITCVGVYMQVDANRSFLAHISIPPTTHPSNTPLARRALANLTIARLQQHAEANNWPCTRPPPFNSPITAVGSDFGSPPRPQNQADATSAENYTTPAGGNVTAPSAALGPELGLGLGSRLTIPPLSPPDDPSTPPWSPIGGFLLPSLTSTPFELLTLPPPTCLGFSPIRALPELQLPSDDDIPVSEVSPVLSHPPSPAPPPSSPSADIDAIKKAKDGKERMRASLVFVCPFVSGRALNDFVADPEWEETRRAMGIAQQTREGDEEEGGRAVMRGVCEWLGVDVLPGFERESAGGKDRNEKWWEDGEVRRKVLEGSLVDPEELMGAAGGVDGDGFGEVGIEDQQLLSPTFEHWLRYWKPMAHGFVIREPGAEPQFWHINESVKGHEISEADMCEENGWVADTQWIEHWSVDWENWDGLFEGLGVVGEQQAEGGNDGLRMEASLLSKETLVAAKEYTEEDYYEMVEGGETGDDWM